MEQNTEKKSSGRGGARKGAGRKRTTAKQYIVYATEEIRDILEAVEGSKSDFICKCIMFYHQHNNQ